MNEAYYSDMEMVIFSIGLSHGYVNLVNPFQTNEIFNNARYNNVRIVYILYIVNMYIEESKGYNFQILLYFDLWR